MKIFFFRESEQKDINPNIIDTKGYGATDITLVHLAQHLSKIHQVKVYCPTSERKFYGDVEYIPYNDYGGFIIECREFEPDVIVVTGNPSIVSRNFINGKHIIFWQKNHPDEMKYFSIPQIIKERRVGKIVFSSDVAAEFAQNFYGNKEMITGIYNGIRDVFYEDNSVEKIENRIIYVGSFAKNKGLLQVLKVAKYLKNFNIEICGSFDMYGTIDERFRNECQQYIKDNVFYSGKSFGASELALKMQQSQLSLVNPMVGNKETCCVSALESMACGLPVVGGGNSLLDKILPKGGGITYTDSLLEKIEEAIKRKDELTARGKQWTSQLRWEKIIPQWEKVFEELI